MALVAHYKLDGNAIDSVLGNNGSWNGTAAYTTGKIGQAGSFNGASTVSFPNTDIIKPTKEVSVSLWFNTTIINDNDYLLLVGRDNANGYALRVVSNGLYGWAGSSSTGTGISANTTYHAVLTYKSGVGLCLYLNGALAVTAANAGDIPYNEVYGGPAIGGHGSALYYFNGWIDDVKIYNHALSLKEVKELYKCKILHYKFDQLEEYTTNLVLNSDFSSGWSSYTNGYDGIGASELGPTAFLNNRQSWCGLYKDVTLPAIGTYTLSVWVRVISRTYTSIGAKLYSSGGGLGDTDVGADWTKVGQWQRLTMTLTYTTTAVRLYLICYGGSNASGYNITAQYSQPQIEQKDHATPYVNGTRADIITDSSGYENNGIININGPKWVVGEKLGRGGVYLGGSNSFTHSNPGLATATTQEWTACAWIKLDDNTTSQQLNNFNQGNYVKYGASTSLLYLNAGANDYYTYGGNVTPTAWHHIAFVFRNSDGLRKIYLDGVDISTGGPNNTSTPSGIPSTVTVGSNLKGYLDDYRIYAMALSAADIIEIYQTRGTIHNDGKLTTHSLQEVGPSYKPSCIDYSTWIVGQVQTSQLGFSLNGDGNYIISKKNPVGVEDIVWATMNNDTASDADGGWDSGNAFGVDTSKKYRYSVWIRRENNLNGTTYFGCQGNSVDLLGGTTAQGNPYFYYGADSFLLNQWCLLVAYIWPISYAGTSSDPTTGIYNAAGIKIGSMGGNSGSGGDYRWHSGVTSGGHRSYLYYSTDLNAYQFWYRPRVDICDGTEPTIGDLINCRENPILLTSLLPSNSINWTLSNITKSASGALRKSGGTDGSWDSQAYSKEGYTGGAYLRFRVAADRATGGAWMFGINSDPTTDAAYASIDYCWYDYTTYAEIYESGTPAWNDAGNPMKVGDTFEIYYDNANIYYYRNGSLKRTVATTANRTFYVDSSFANIYANDQIYDIYFGPQRILTGVQSTGNYVATEFSEVGPTNGLVAYYNFDGATSTFIPDVMGLNNGTAYNTPTFTTMKDKRAITFNGTNQYFITSPFNKIDGQALSVSCWFYQVGRTGYQDLISNRSYISGDKLNWLIYTHATDGSIQLHGASQNKSSTIPSLSAWHHVVAVVTTGGVSTLYLDNVLVQTVNGYTYGNVSPANCYFGTCYASSEYFNGSLAEIRIYNRALDTKEIETLYNLKPTNLYIEDNEIVNSSYLIEG